MREHFDRSVRYLPDEAKYVVFLRHFRGEIEVEEAAFFVLDFDAERGEISLSDGTRELLDVASLERSPRDGAWLCRVKRDLHPDGLLARFERSAQAAALASVELRDGRAELAVAGVFQPLPPSLA